MLSKSSLPRLVHEFVAVSVLLFALRHWFSIGGQVARGGRSEVLREAALLVMASRESMCLSLVSLQT